MSMSPSGTGSPTSSATSSRSRAARTAPRRWMPTTATRVGDGEPAVFSTISCAMRTRVRRTSSRSRTVFSLKSCPFLASPDRVIGTVRRNLAPFRDDTPARRYPDSKVTSERAQAYGRLMRTVRDDGPDALTPEECALVREAADSLLFCDERAWSDEARDGLTRVGDLAGDLVGTGRWGPDRAEQLLRDIEACGPMAPVG